MIEKSHHDPVTDVFWVQSRTGNECVSSSTDGQLLWWDIRKLSAGTVGPRQLASHIIRLSSHLECPQVQRTPCNFRDRPASTSAVPAWSTALTPEPHATWLARSKDRCCWLIARWGAGVLGMKLCACSHDGPQAKKDAESTKSIKTAYGIEAGRHHGPVYGLQRHPFSPKYFMTVGDWTTRVSLLAGATQTPEFLRCGQVWMEDLKTPIMTTKYDSAYLSAGCWSPTRPGVLFTTKVDGTLDVWDFFFKQNDPTFSTKVCHTAERFSTLLTPTSDWRQQPGLHRSAQQGQHAGAGLTGWHYHHPADLRQSGRTPAEREASHCADV